MDAKRIVFPEANKVELEAFDFTTDQLTPQAAAIRTRYSIVSAGTELACLSGNEAWAKMPFYPGYGSVGEVVAVGGAAQGFKPGDRVFTYGKHASNGLTSTVAVAVPDGLDGRTAAFARMVGVSITALRVSEAELGDYVAVYGLGLVGNFAAQLFTLAGCEVIGIDLAPRRLELAKSCGAAHAISPAQVDVKEAVADITRGQMCRTVVEAIGNPKVGEVAADLAAKLGEVILLGSPRGAHESDLTTLLNRVHLWGNGCVTFKGAHEWRYPTLKDTTGHAKHSIERNIEVILRLMSQGKLCVEPLLTHVLPPTACARAYEGLRDNKDEYVGVVFDWA